jgi:thiol-disulfide isomerase/thioredoxin
MKRFPFIFLVVAAVALASSVCAQQISGIGAALAKEGESLVVKRIFPDSPAARSNVLEVGDRILEIGEVDRQAIQTNSLKLEDAVARIRGAQGTTVRLTIIPAGRDESYTRIVTIVRGELTEVSRWGDGKLLPAGTRAPNTTWIRLAGGRSEQLKDFDGKVIVLEFWATWCKPCQPIMEMLQALPKKYPHWAGKVALIAASVDENLELPEKHLKLKGWSRTHNVWADSDTVRAYGVNALPTTYIISRDGVVVSSGHVIDVGETVNRLIGEH